MQTSSSLLRDLASLILLDRTFSCWIQLLCLACTCLYPAATRVPPTPPPFELIQDVDWTSLGQEGLLNTYHTMKMEGYLSCYGNEKGWWSGFPAWAQNKQLKQLVEHTIPEVCALQDGTLLRRFGVNEILYCFSYCCRAVNRKVKHEELELSRYVKGDWLGRVPISEKYRINSG